MGFSAIQEQHDIVIDAIKNVTQGNDWWSLVLDDNSKKIVYNVTTESEIYNQNIAQIELIEQNREMNPTIDAIYILIPQSHIVETFIADFRMSRYRRYHVFWASLLTPQLRELGDRMDPSKRRLTGFSSLPIDFFPRESHLITFRDPESFAILYRPAYNNLVPDHMRLLAQKITCICVSLGEYPKVRYYRPRNTIREDALLCWRLARAVQEQLDEHEKLNPNFPPSTSRPTGILLITERSMDLMAPLVHEFTYQAMAHDLLHIEDAVKATYRMKVNEGTATEEEKDMELQEEDEVWVDNRHRHMKDTIEKLMGDFQKFLDENHHFTKDSQNTSLGAIKDMLAGLPKFQEAKLAYSLHLTMAQECMNVFQKHKLPDIASVEQTLATGLDEDYRKPKNILEQVVRLLDDESITLSDRLRLVMIYILYRDGVIPKDIGILLEHSSLPAYDQQIVKNLELLGAHPMRGLKEARPPPQPLFPNNTRNATQNEENALSRFEPAVKHMLDDLTRGALDQTTFPYVKPPMDPNEDSSLSSGSLRAAAPRWAGTGRRVAENRQRIIVFMAGGATYSEARACYDTSAAKSKDVFLATSHMLNPRLFVRQVGDLSIDTRRRDMPRKPVSAPIPAAPMRAPPGQPSQQQGPRPPVQAMANMTMSSTSGSAPTPPPQNSHKDHKKDHKLHKEEHKKERSFLGLKKKK